MKKSKKKLSIGLIIALVGFPQVSETIYTPALPLVVKGLQTSANMVEKTLSIYFLGFALGVLVWGTISDWRGRRNSMLMGIFIYGVGTFACANAESIEALLCWRFVQAFGASVGSVITQTILRDSYESEERTKIFSIMAGALAFSPAIGPMLGGFISEFYGWRPCFSVLIILSIIIFLWSFFSLPETRPTHTLDSPQIKNFRLLVQMTKSRELWGHVLLIGATNGILFGFYQEAPFLFIEELGLPLRLYGFVGLIIATSTILAARTSFLQNKKYSYLSIIQFGAIFVFLGGLLFTLSVLTGIISSKIIGILISIIILFFVFFGIGLIIPSSLSHALKPYQHFAGTAGSIFGSYYYCMIAGFTWIMSMIHNGTTLPLPIYITILGLILMVASQMIFLPLRTRPN